MKVVLVFLVGFLLVANSLSAKDCFNSRQHQVILEIQNSTGLVCPLKLGQSVYLPKGDFRLFATKDCDDLLVLFSYKGEQKVVHVNACDIVQEVSLDRKK